MPSTALNTFSQLKLEPVQNPDLARTIAVKLAASTTFVRGAILGEITAQPGVYDIYDPNANDGLEVPKAILAYGTVTDSDGKPTLVTYPYPPFPDITLPAYVRGEFSCAEIDTAMGDSGTLLAAAIAAGFGRLEQGTTAAGIVKI